MSEQGFQSKVIKELRKREKFVLKTQSGRGVPIGTPDIITIDKDGLLVGLEMKDPDPKNKYRATPEQQYQGAKIRANGGRWYVVDSYERWVEVRDTII